MPNYFNSMPGISGMNLDYRALSEGFLVGIGVVLAILASFITCLGLNLQKQSLCTPGNEEINPWSQPKWVVGFFCVLIGSIIDFLAFGLAPQSLLAPLAALSLVWNLGMASYLLGEQYTRSDIVAVGLIFFGTGLTVVFASHKEHEYTLDQLKALYAEPRMSTYGIIIPTLLVVHYCLSRYVEEINQYMNLSKTQRRNAELLGYAGFAGIMGGQSILFAKSTVELLKDAAHGDDVFYHFETYCIIIIMIVCLLCQITFLNGGLRRFDSLLVVPMYQSYWIISGVVGGLVYFGEWEEFSATQMFMFVLGTCITLSGLLILTTKEHTPDEVQYSSVDRTDTLTSIDLESEFVLGGISLSRRDSNSDISRRQQPSTTPNSSSSQHQVKNV